MFLQRTGRVPGDVRQDKRLYFGGSFPWEQIIDFILEYEDDRYPGNWILVDSSITTADLPPLWTTTFRITNNGTNTIVLAHDFGLVDAIDSSGVTSPIPEVLQVGEVATFNLYAFSPTLAPRTIRLNIGYNDGNIRAVDIHLSFAQIPGYWDPPQNLRATDITTNSFNLHWDASVATKWPVVSYDVIMDNNIVGNTALLTFPLTDLAEDTVYHMRVVAIDDHNNRSEPSDELLVTTLATQYDNFKIFYADQLNNIIRLITTDVVNSFADVVTIAGLPKMEGYYDGTGQGARFKSPIGGKVNLTGDVSDFIFVDNSSVRQVTLSGVVTTIAGDPFEVGYEDAQGVQARFKPLGGLVLAGDGNIYATDTYNSTIRRIDPAGNVTTFAGARGEQGHIDGNGTESRFFYPSAICLGPDGNLYVTDYGDNGGNWSGIRKITLTGDVSTYLELNGDQRMNMLTFDFNFNRFYALINWESNNVITWQPDPGETQPIIVYAGDWRYQPIMQYPSGDVISKNGHQLIVWIPTDIENYPEEDRSPIAGGYWPIAGYGYEYGYEDGDADHAKFGWVGR